MSQLLVTAVFEGTPVDGLVPGRPVAGLRVEVGGPGRDVVGADTDEKGVAALELPEAGSWTISARQQRDGGQLLGLMTVQVGGPFALFALPVRWRPEA
jgi:hypothetical protein